jgi:hypothetical protein
MKGGLAACVDSCVHLCLLIACCFAVCLLFACCLLSVRYIYWIYLLFGQQIGISLLINFKKLNQFLNNKK